MSIARGEPAETRVEPPQPSSPNGVEPIAKPVSSYHPPTVTSATKVLTALPENPSSSSAGLDEDVSSGGKPSGSLPSKGFEDKPDYYQRSFQETAPFPRSFRFSVPSPCCNGEGGC